MTEFKHIPVMLRECIDGLNIKKDGVYLDGTLGGAGHSSEIAKRAGRLIAIDRDEDAINFSKERLKEFHNVTFVHDNFFNMKAILKELGIAGVDGILLDLGVSSYQLDSIERGFSYSQDSGLDMRMDRSQSLSAEEVVNSYSVSDLTRILKDYGEEKFAYQIAKNIEKERQKERITTSGKLKEIIEKSIPEKLRFKFGLPYKRTFQALRIEVNGELENLENAVRDAFDCLNSKGRLVIITFHSLEDRIVKKVFNDFATGCVCKEYSPICICGRKERGILITKKPLVATEKELEENSRSASAKVRIIEKI